MYYKLVLLVYPSSCTVTMRDLIFIVWLGNKSLTGSVQNQFRKLPLSFKYSIVWQSTVEKNSKSLLSNCLKRQSTDLLYACLCETNKFWWGITSRAAYWVVLWQDNLFVFEVYGLIVLISLFAKIKKKTKHESDKHLLLIKFSCHLNCSIAACSSMWFIIGTVVLSFLHAPFHSWIYLTGYDEHYNLVTRSIGPEL